MKDLDRMMRQYQGHIRKRRTPEELKAAKESAKMRQAAQRTDGGRAEGPIDEQNWEEMEARAIAKAKTSKLSKRELRELAPATESHPHDASRLTAMVVSTTRRSCKALLDGRIVDCELPRGIAIVQRSTLAVGDRIVISPRDDRFAVDQVLPRQTKLSRHDPHQPSLERVIAANIDVVTILVSVKSPPLRPGLIDRYLVAIQRGGAQPIVGVNKIDLASPDELREGKSALAIYDALNVQVIWFSASTGEGIEELAGALRGKTAVFVGHSGVGKSSTLNALDPALNIRTADVHKQGTGRHTTTGSALHDLGDGTLIIDTPGIREFGLWQIEKQSLRWYFPELEETAEFCRYADCTHTHEPVCGVKEAVLEGTVPSARYETYLRLYNE